MIETTQAAAARLNLPAQATSHHTGSHICLDGRRYFSSCLVTDPAMEQVARHLLEEAGEP